MSTVHPISGSQYLTFSRRAARCKPESGRAAEHMHALFAFPTPIPKEKRALACILMLFVSHRTEHIIPFFLSPRTQNDRLICHPSSRLFVCFFAAYLIAENSFLTICAVSIFYEPPSKNFIQHPAAPAVLPSTSIVGAHPLYGAGYAHPYTYPYPYAAPTVTAAPAVVTSVTRSIAVCCFFPPVIFFFFQRILCAHSWHLAFVSILCLCSPLSTLRRTLQPTPRRTLQPTLRRTLRRTLQPTPRRTLQLRFPRRSSPR